MKSFSQSSGKSANSKSGEFSGALLGKMASGLDALEALANLAVAKVNRFMELAAQAAHVARQTLSATKTIPFATPDLEFNPAINPAKVAMAPKTPGLGSSGTMRKKHKDEGK